MLHKSLAIALQTIPYRESSVITRFFTEDYGLQSFIASGVRASKAKMSPALFQPLSLAELVYHYHPEKELHRLSDIKSAVDFSSFLMHPAKSAMAMLVAEYLSKVLKEQLENKALFDLTFNWVIQLSAKESAYESAHIGFIWKSFSSLGIAPESWHAIFPSERAIVDSIPDQLEEYFQSEDAFIPLKINVLYRRMLLDSLLYYASTQLEGMGQLKSLPVLRQLFS